MFCTLNVGLIKKRQKSKHQATRRRMLTRSPKAVISQAQKT